MSSSPTPRDRDATLTRSWAAKLAEAFGQPAEGAMALVAAWRPRRRMRLVEQGDDVFLLCHDGAASAAQARFRFGAGGFVAEGRAASAVRWKGAEVELVLSERRFLFPRLQAPRKATAFLDAIVRSQIDRLTPWTQAHAEAGFSAELSGEETSVTVAAAAKTALAPYVEAARALGADVVVVFASRSDGAPIRVCVRAVNREARVRRYRQAMFGALVVSIVFGLGAAALEIWLAGQRQAAEAEIAHRVAEMQANAGGAAQDPQTEAALRNKRDVPADVVILEVLSRALPDDAYLTQLRISGTRLEIDGVSRSASSLVALIEQTAPFQRAQFSAPTTPAPADGAEQFHIAADIAAAPASRP